MYLSLGEELGLDSGFRETGYYIVAETEEEKEDFLRLIEVRREAGVEGEWVEPEEGRRRFPDLAWDRFVGATYTADDGYVLPPIAARKATCAVLAEEAVELFEMYEAGTREAEVPACVRRARESLDTPVIRFIMPVRFADRDILPGLAGTLPHDGGTHHALGCS